MSLKDDIFAEANKVDRKKAILYIDAQGLYDLDREVSGPNRWTENGADIVRIGGIEFVINRWDKTGWHVGYPVEASENALSVPVMYPMSAERAEELRNIYTFHRVPGSQPRFDLIRELTLQLAIVIEEICPPSRQRSQAQSSLELVRMQANAAIAVNEPEAPNAAV